MIGKDAMSLKEIIVGEMERISAEQGRELAPLTDELILLESGLDSLCFAILVARLEDVLGVDPFTASDDVYYPVTLREFVRIYDDAVK
jgi:acyl carrier protein